MDGDDSREAPTIIEPSPAARESTPSIASRSTPASLSVAISEQAIAAVEAQRMRGLLNGIAGSAIVTVVLLFLIGGDTFAKQLHAGVLATSAVLSLTIAFWFRNPKLYHPKLALYLILGQVAVLVTGYYFWGVFSAYGALVPLTIYIAVGSASRIEAIVGVTLCVVAQAAFALATALGYVDGRGLVEPVLGRADLRTQLVGSRSCNSSRSALPLPVVPRGETAPLRSTHIIKRSSISHAAKLSSQKRSPMHVPRVKQASVAWAASPIRSSTNSISVKSSVAARWAKSTQQIARMIRRHSR